MRMILEEGPERVLEKRVEAMRWIKRRARELESEEKKLHDAMPEWRAKVVKGKKFLLFKELVDLVGHEDKDLFRDLVFGMRITGNAEPTQLFVVDFKPAQLEDKDPVASCKVFSSGSSEEDPDAHEPKACEQVDIAEEFSVNPAYGTPEKLDLGGVDDEAAMEQFLEILGWQIASGKDKRVPAAVKFSVLGVVVDLSESKRGVIRVENKASRAEEMQEAIEEVEKECAMSRGTDGHAGCGVVIFSGRLEKPSVMSFKIPSHILDLWKKDGQEQLIAQVDGSEETAQAPYRGTLILVVAYLSAILFLLEYLASCFDEWSFSLLVFGAFGMHALVLKERRDSYLVALEYEEVLTVRQQLLRPEEQNSRIPFYILGAVLSVTLLIQIPSQAKPFAYLGKAAIYFLFMAVHVSSYFRSSTGLSKWREPQLKEGEFLAVVGKHLQQTTEKPEKLSKMLATLWLVSKLLSLLATFAALLVLTLLSI
eukprot:symbB.v1.2.028531.t1/scaffold3033.1/size83406/1